MQFYRPRKPVPTIPIVSLVDILVILLIFFIVTMQPKQKRTILDISMPVVGDLSTEQVVEQRSVLAMTEQGEITLNSTQVHPNLLVEYLTVLKEENPQAQLELELDKRVRFEQMIMLSEALTKAGYEANLPARVLDAAAAGAES